MPTGSGEVEVFGLGAIAADLGGEEVAVAFDGGEGFSENGFRLGEAVVGGDIDEVDAEVEGDADGADALGFGDAAEDGAQGGGAVGEDGDVEAGGAEGAELHGGSEGQRGSP
jgi:hypothetical protein